MSPTNRYTMPRVDVDSDDFDKDSTVDESTSILVDYHGDKDKRIGDEDEIVIRIPKQYAARFWWLMGFGAFALFVTMYILSASAPASGGQTLVSPASIATPTTIPTAGESNASAPQNEHTLTIKGNDNKSTTTAPTMPLVTVTPTATPIHTTSEPSKQATATPTTAAPTTTPLVTITPTAIPIPIHKTTAPSKSASVSHTTAAPTTKPLVTATPTAIAIHTTSEPSKQATATPTTAAPTTTPLVTITPTAIPIHKTTAPSKPASVSHTTAAPPTAEPPLTTTATASPVKKSTDIPTIATLTTTKPPSILTPTAAPMKKTTEPPKPASVQPTTPKSEVVCGEWQVGINSTWDTALVRLIRSDLEKFALELTVETNTNGPCAGILPHQFGACSYRWYAEGDELIGGDFLVHEAPDSTTHKGRIWINEIESDFAINLERHVVSSVEFHKMKKGLVYDNSFYASDPRHLLPISQAALKCVASKTPNQALPPPSKLPDCAFSSKEAAASPPGWMETASWVKRDSLLSGVSPDEYLMQPKIPQAFWPRSCRLRRVGYQDIKSTFGGGPVEIVFIGASRVRQWIGRVEQALLDGTPSDIRPIASGEHIDVTLANRHKAQHAVLAGNVTVSSIWINNMASPLSALPILGDIMYSLQAYCNATAPQPRPQLLIFFSIGVYEIRRDPLVSYDDLFQYFRTLLTGISEQCGKLARLVMVTQPLPQMQFLGAVHAEPIPMPTNQLVEILQSKYCAECGNTVPAPPLVRSNRALIAAASELGWTIVDAGQMTKPFHAGSLDALHSVEGVVDTLVHTMLRAALQTTAP